ncbi:MAG: porin [Flavobacteriaceae bacterium]|nr:porin [Flavobacteriaceae bacterium]
MKKFKKVTQVLLISTMFGFLYGQELEGKEEETPTFSVSGSVDTYMRYNLSNDFDAAPGTSFANLSGFSLGMANVILGFEGEKSGFVADLVYGPRGADAVFGSVGNSSSIINQMYVYFSVGENTTLTIGNFNTFLGYEVISPVANFNYSTSYMFSYGPFSHTGIKADFSLSDKSSLMIGVLNPTDMTESNPNDTYLLGVQFGFSGQYINYLGGQGYSQIDYTGGFNLSESFFLGINATSASNNTPDGGFSGLALYPQLTLSDSFSLGLRGEVFSDKKDFTGVFENASGDADNTSITLTGSYSSGNMILKPEIRIDSASEKIFKDGLGASDNLASFVIAAIYSF